MGGITITVDYYYFGRIASSYAPCAIAIEFVSLLSHHPLTTAIESLPLYTFTELYKMSHAAITFIISMHSFNCPGANRE